MPQLSVSDHHGRRTTYDLASGQRVHIGRSEQNELALGDPSLSRRHAEIYDQDGSWMIRDCGSRNGTLVGGQRIERPVALEGGVPVAVGSCTLVLERPAADSGTVVFADGPLTAAGTMILSHDELIEAPASAPGDEAGFERELAKLRRRLEIVERANLELLAHQSPDVLLPKILDVVFEAVRPERAALVLRQSDGELTCRIARGHTGGEFAISRTIAQKVVDEHVSVLTSNAQSDERFASGASIVDQGIQAVMAAPLWNRREVTGLIYADSRVGSGLFSDDDLRLLTMLANIAAVQMQNAALFLEQLEKQRFEREARAAAEIQRRLLPRRRPEIPGYAFEGHTEPCYECGGDYYDCLDIGDTRAGIVLSDVAGKGMGAAMLMAVIQATLQAQAGTGPELKPMVQALGRAISRSAPSNRYATLLFLDLDYATHRLRYINAGHAPLPLHVQPSGTVHELPAGGTPLGLFPEFEYADDELQLGPGDLVFACTDGVTDLENPEGEMYGEERLRELLRSVARRTPAEIRRVLDASLEEFAGGNRRPDDLSYILVRRDD